MNERYTAWGALKSVLSKRTGDKGQELYIRSNYTNSVVREEAWGLRSLVVVSRMDRVRNEEVRWRA